VSGLPLAGITVVALEQAVAGPFATRQLADLGARVIKVERVDGGDFARGYDSAVRGVLGSHFAWLNRSKESVALDLRTAEGRAVLAELVARADVFLQNLAPHAAERHGFASAALRARHPRLVTVDISGYGTSGPYGHKRAYDMLVQAESGIISVTGTADTPVKVGTPICDIAVAMYAFSGVLAALVRRGHTGDGSAVDVTMFDAATEWMGHAVYTTAYAGQPPARAPLAHPAVVPYGAFPTRDGGQVIIGVQNDRGWRTLATKLLDQPELVTDPAYATNQARLRHRDEVDAMVTAATRALDRDELLAVLDKAEIAHGVINDGYGVLAHPQLAARDRWRTIGSPAGPIRALLPPIGIDGAEPRLDPVPALGEHTDAVLGELGYPAEGIAALHRRGVVAGST
jgi:itaconate CoA-transferase